MAKAQLKDVFNFFHPLEISRLANGDLMPWCPGYIGFEQAAKKLDRNYGSACKKFGKKLVHKAMDEGLICLRDVVNTKCAAFDPKNATADSLMTANGVCIG